MTTESIMFITTAVLNMIGAALLMMGLHSDQLQNISKVYKFAIACAVFGLVWQSVHNVAFVITGAATANNIVPFWYLKDLAWVVMGGYFGYLMYNKELTVTNKQKDCE